MIGYQFYSYNPEQNGKTKFEQLLDIFMQLLTYTSGDAAESLSWMNELDKQYHFTDKDYGMGDFIEDLKQNGYLKEDPANGDFSITGKSEQTIRKKSLEEILGNSKKRVRVVIKHLNQVRAMKSILIQDHSSLVIC